MTRREAQEILLSCQPGREDRHDPKVAAALELTRTDAELRQWYNQQGEWDTAVRAELGSLPVPHDLKAAILAGPKIVTGPAHWWHRRPALIAAAATIVLLITLAVTFLNRPTTTDTFAEFRTRMIGTVLREYRMDLETSDMRQIRAFLGSHGAPADYAVPAGLQKLKLAGCGVLNWQGKSVSMVCFEGQKSRLVWMFVAQPAHWRDRPQEQPTFDRVISCATANWSQGDAVYVIASETDESALRKLL